MGNLNKVLGIKKIPKSVTTNPTPNPLHNLVYFAPKCYSFIAAWAIWTNNLWLNEWIYLRHSSRAMSVVQLYTPQYSCQVICRKKSIRKRAQILHFFMLLNDVITSQWWRHWQNSSTQAILWRGRFKSWICPMLFP